MFYVFIIIELLVFCQQIIVCKTVTIGTKVNSSFDSSLDSSLESHLKEAISQSTPTLRTLKFDGLLLLINYFALFLFLF
jgi:hypothetical protein